ncbi:hypothetical protein KDL01_05960 [Actinospica durhamensis]|uniref:Uncharacterized protein n=1 Tax=Actinospica durhamensis TaxID=1508375 RepID=A0A941IS15_9ACTN|nr:hypothetical protein [Actinospica durhamensis]MBR7832796.1 hypothetical protein [Actinospica durhamensis]
MTESQEQRKPGIDEFPSDRSQLANLTPEERSAIYLNSIRKSMAFFVFLAVVGIALSFAAMLKH